MTKKGTKNSNYQFLQFFITGSGRLMILDVNATGRFGSCPVLDAHSNSVTDFAFSPFNHLQLATAGADFTVRIIYYTQSYHLPEPKNKLN